MLKFPWISVNYKGSCLGILPYPAYLWCTNFTGSTTVSQVVLGQVHDRPVVTQRSDLLLPAFYPDFGLFCSFCFDATVKLEAERSSYPLIIGHDGERLADRRVQIGLNLRNLIQAFGSQSSKTGAGFRHRVGGQRAASDPLNQDVSQTFCLRRRYLCGATAYWEDHLYHLFSVWPSWACFVTSCNTIVCKNDNINQELVFNGILVESLYTSVSLLYACLVEAEPQYNHYLEKWPPGWLSLSVYCI